MNAGIQIEFDEVAANFTIVPNQIIYNRKLSSDTRFLWLYLRSHKVGYPLGYRQMEADTGWSEVTVRKNLKALEAAGLVRLNQTRVGSRNGKLLISLLLAQTIDSEGSTFEGSGTKGLNKTINTNKTKEETTLAQDKLERAFSEFWEVYPRKVGKAEAKKAFVKAHACANGEVVLGAQRFAADPNLPADKNFIPHPATWLNAGRWEDEPLPHRDKSPEEKAAYAKAESERRRQADLEASRRAREESEAARRALELNPPKRCEHDRVAVICPKCSRIK
jgi:hypothetical protein